MTKKTRTVLFFVLLILFLISAPTTALYSLGYRFDFEKRKITQTGGLYLKVWPKNVQIYLNGKLVKKTDFFFGTTLIENLLPKKYEIEIKKNGFHSWKKILEIQKKQVSDVKNVVLIPEKTNFTILANEIYEFFFLFVGKRIILLEQEENGWVLKLFDVEKNLKIRLIGEKDISKTSTVELLDFGFLPHDKEIFLKVKIKDKIDDFVLSLEKTPPILSKKDAPLSLPENILTHQVLDGEFYYLDNSGYLFKSNTLFYPKLKINEQPLPLNPLKDKISNGAKKGIAYKMMKFKNYFFIQQGQTLYLFNPDLKSFEKFFEPIKEVKISPDFKKLVYFSDSEIWILFLEEKFDHPYKKAGERLFLTRLSEKINQVFWYTSHYLIFVAGDKIKIAEIDDRDKINIVDFTEFKDPKIFFNQSDKKIYILSERNFYSSEKLLP